jgi:uncharacterized membrane protein
LSQSWVVSGVLFVLYGGLGVAFAALSRMMRTDRLRPNALVGIRIPATLRGQDAWYAGHRAAAGHVLIVAGLFGAGALVSLVLGVVGAQSRAYDASVIVVSVLVLVAVIHAAVTAGRAAKRHR